MILRWLFVALVIAVGMVAIGFLLTVFLWLGYAFLTALAAV